MEITDPSLGMFSLLPAEIRIMIWKYLSPHLHVGRSLPKKPNYLSPDQGILLTSHKIYAEVAAEVPSGFNGNTIRISIDPEYKYQSWIKAKNAKNDGVQWNLEDLPDAISRGFCDLPWHNLNVRIFIRAPDKNDGGQIICLYKKVRALVEVLKEAKGFLSVWVVLGNTENTSWFDNTQPLCSIKNKADLVEFGGELRGAKWDYQFIFPLLLQIRNAKAARIYFMETFKREGENLAIEKFFSKGQQVMQETTPYRSELKRCIYFSVQLERYLDYLFTFVERIVDCSPSKTANMLRLERFSSWYTDKLHGNSPYEDKFSKLFLDDIQVHGTPETMNERYRMMRTHNPLSLAYRAAFPETYNLIKHLDTDPKGWNQDAWHCVYKDGIPPVESEEASEAFWKWYREHANLENITEFIQFRRHFSIPRRRGF